MKVGDYVRFDYHRVSIPIQIAKITETHYDSEDDSICYSTDIGLVIDESNLVKEPSPNIIDLIEVGDYVNGYPVAKIYKSVNKDIGRVIEYETDNVGGYEYEAEDLWESYIKSISIVTKEQFESMEYKVGE